MDSTWHRQGGSWKPGAEASAERIAVAIDGASPLEHGWLRGEDDEGDSLAEALATLRAASTPVTAITRIARSNHRSLERIGQTVRGADAWVLVFPEVRGPRFAALAPRLTMAMPWALRAAARWGENAFLLGAPVCLVGPHTGRVLRGSDRRYDEVCGRCEARPRCEGVAAGYLERFGGDELRPRPAAPPAEPAEALVPPVAQRLGGTG